MTTADTAINADAVYYEGNSMPLAHAIKIGTKLGQWKEEK